jgi:hypothetical protein
MHKGSQEVLSVGSLLKQGHLSLCPYTGFPPQTLYDLCSIPPEPETESACRKKVPKLHFNTLVCATTIQPALL